jgi:hypothetical protein
VILYDGPRTNPTSHINNRPKTPDGSKVMDKNKETVILKKNKTMDNGNNPPGGGNNNNDGSIQRLSRR